MPRSRKADAFISKVQRSVSMDMVEEGDIEIHGRHDPTIPPRMVPVAEAMLALVIADHMIRRGRIDSESLSN